MRNSKTIALAVSCFLAGAATSHVAPQKQKQAKDQQGPQVLLQTPGIVTTMDPQFYVDDRWFRVDCDNWMTLRPKDEDYWARMEDTTVTIPQAVEVAERVMLEKRGFEAVHTTFAEFVLLGKPWVKVEVFGKRTSEEGEEVVKRWHISVNDRGKVMNMIQQERLPGTPLTGEVVELDSGVQVSDIREGAGQAVTADSRVRCHYIMTCLDGSLVLDTYADREPLIFEMNDPPIEGFRTGLIGARVGGKRKLIVPPNLAFGDVGLEPHLVPPGATVVFDIEVQNVN